jgi:hypothetical protein
MNEQTLRFWLADAVFTLRVGGTISDSATIESLVEKAIAEVYAAELGLEQLDETAPRPPQPEQDEETVTILPDYLQEWRGLRAKPKKPARRKCVRRPRRPR